MKRYKEFMESSPDMGPVKTKEKVSMVRHKESGKELVVLSSKVQMYLRLGFELVK